MAEQRIPLGKVVGENGKDGTQIFTITTTTPNAPSGAKIGDKILNSGTSTYVVGGLSMAIGALAEITSITPFTVISKGNIRGATGATGATGQQGNQGEQGMTGSVGAGATTQLWRGSIVIEEDGYIEIPDFELDFDEDWSNMPKVTLQFIEGNAHGSCYYITGIPIVPYSWNPMLKKFEYKFFDVTNFEIQDLSFYAGLEVATLNYPGVSSIIIAELDNQKELGVELVAIFLDHLGGNYY